MNINHNSIAWDASTGKLTGSVKGTTTALLDKLCLSMVLDGFDANEVVGTISLSISTTPPGGGLGFPVVVGKKSASSIEIKTYSPFDLNADGMVDGADLAKLLVDLGNGSASPDEIGELLAEWDWHVDTLTECSIYVAASQYLGTFNMSGADMMEHKGQAMLDIGMPVEGPQPGATIVLGFDLAFARTE